MSITKRFEVPPTGFDRKLLSDAAKTLQEGGIVAFPTETVYGLGASCRQPDAVARLVQLKQRAPDKPFSYHLADPKQATELVSTVPATAQRLMDRYWPGPLTLILPASPEVEGSTVGLRIPANEIARELIELVEVPLLAPSANPRGEPPAVRADEVLRYFDSQIDAVIDGGTCQIQQSSTVVQFTENSYEVLREGIITREMVHQLIEGRRILFVCTGNTCRSPMAAALFKKHLAAKLEKSPEDLDELGYKILSAGTFAGYGNYPSENAVSALEEMGWDLSTHRSQPVTKELLAEVDRVFALGRSHHQILLQLAPGIAERLSMISDEGIADPVGGDLETYRRCAREIEGQILRLLENLD